MIILDTSVLIRYFTQDDRIKAERVKKLLETEKEIIIPDVVLPEIEYVLIKLSKAKRAGLIKAFRFLNSLRNISLTKEARNAITLFSKSKLDMADCIIVSHSFKGSLASFDNKLLEIKGANPFWK